MNTKAKGTYWEHQVRDHFKSIGCYVTRSAASVFPDLVAIPPCKGIEILTINNGVVFADWKPIFIECKSTGKVSNEEISKLNEICQKHNAICLAAYPRHGFSSSKKDNIIFVSHTKSLEKK